jgi:hypothetical protein
MSRATAAAEQPANDFETARRRFDEFKARREQARLQAEGLQAALQLADTRQASADAPVNLVLNRQAAIALQGGTLSPRQIRRELEEVQETVDALTEQAPAEFQAWELARRAEADRIALELQPAHRAAALAIARAVEQLSAAIIAERQVRAEFAAFGLEPESGYLPDASSRLRAGTLAEFESNVSAWRRDMLRLGVIA